ncbi:hypothetical protein [Streptomyces sp. AA1529]|uniref:hypothetical protein n=1 Tax=Streptomyces sp. AA1529 TaxID=1203257 RepID=UPI0007C809AA|nr:hypothetical protein [Streptomyces sp. AA1529]
MQIPRSGYVAAGLFLGVALALSACGQQRTGPTVTGPAPSLGAALSPSPTRSPIGPARGNVEPDSHGGAPHYRENNGFKIPKGMSPASEEIARREADRIEPVLKRLWKNRVWDPKSVRAALLRLGYRNEGPDSEQGRGTLIVQGMGTRLGLTDAHPVRPEGARVALRVRHDACVTAFTQPTNYLVKVNGRFLETGCFEPRSGH